MVKSVVVLDRAWVFINTMHDSEHYAHLQKNGALQGYCPTPMPLTPGVGFWSRGRHKGLRVPFRGRPANIQGTRTGGPIPYNPNGSRILHGGGRQARGPADGNSPGTLPESVDRTHGSRLPKGPPIGRNGPAGSYTDHIPTSTHAVVEHIRQGDHSAGLRHTPD